VLAWDWISSVRLRFRNVELIVRGNTFMLKKVKPMAPRLRLPVQKFGAPSKFDREDLLDQITNIRWSDVPKFDAVDLHIDPIYHPSYRYAGSGATAICPTPGLTAREYMELYSRPGRVIHVSTPTLEVLNEQAQARLGSDSGAGTVGSDVQPGRPAGRER